MDAACLPNENEGYDFLFCFFFFVCVCLFTLSWISDTCCVGGVRQGQDQVVGNCNCQYKRCLMY